MPVASPWDFCGRSDTAKFAGKGTRATVGVASIVDNSRES